MLYFMMFLQVLLKNPRVQNQVWMILMLRTAMKVRSNRLREKRLISVVVSTSNQEVNNFKCNIEKGSDCWQCTFCIRCKCFEITMCLATFILFFKYSDMVLCENASGEEENANWKE